MILTLFLTLIGISLLLFIMGYYSGDEPYTVVGLTFFFLLSIAILNGQLEYQTGTNSTICDYQEIYIYGDNYTGYHWDYEYPLPSVSDVNLFHMNRTYNGCVETTTKVYSSWDDTTSHLVGWSLAVASGLGFALFWIHRRKEEDV